MTDSTLSEQAFLVMTVLAAGPQHGYAVMEEVRRGIGVTLHAGTLYTILDRLSAGGLIEVEREETVKSRIRRYYRLTPAGAERLATESERLQRMAEAARRNLGLTIATTAFGGAR